MLVASKNWRGIQLIILNP